MGKTAPDYEKLVDIPYVEDLLGLSWKTVKSRIAEGKFPPPIPLGRKPRWRRETIDTWLSQADAPAVQKDPLPVDTPAA